MIAPLYRFERVASTMELIHQLAEEGHPAGTTVIASEQIEGRGSRGRAWSSPPGGLWLSTLFRPTETGGIEVIGLRAGLLVAETLEAVTGLEIGLKWPNDLMLGERKIGGILCEARWQGGVLGWVAVGVGINVSNPLPDHLRHQAASLAEARPGVTLDQVTDAIVATLPGLDLSRKLLAPEELERFARRNWLSGRQLLEPAAGSVLGLSEDGSLLIRTNSGILQALRTGSVELAPVPVTR